MLNIKFHFAGQLGGLLILCVCVCIFLICVKSSESMKHEKCVQGLFIHLFFIIWVRNI